MAVRASEAEREWRTRYHDADLAMRRSERMLNRHRKLDAMQHVDPTVRVEGDRSIEAPPAVTLPGDYCEDDYSERSSP